MPVIILFVKISGLITVFLIYLFISNYQIIILQLNPTHPTRWMRWIIICQQFILYTVSLIFCLFHQKNCMIFLTN